MCRDNLPLVKTASGKGGMRYLSRKQVLATLSDHEGAWHLLAQAPVEAPASN
jgi:DNA-binding IclR family transcriptional regulator